MTDVTTIGAPEYGPPLAHVSIRMPAPGTSGGFHFQRTTRHKHQGVDLVHPVGTKWIAAADGTIEQVVTAPTGVGSSPGFRGYGKIAVLKHKDRRTGRNVWFLYSHGDTVTVRVGQRVSLGDTLGTVGRTQYARNPTRPEGSMGAHLHHEVSSHSYPQGAEQATRLDPAAFYRSNGVVFAGAPAPSREETPETMPDMPPARRDEARAEPPAPREIPGPAAEPEPGDALMAKQQLRTSLMARLIRTDMEVVTLRAQLVQAGHGMAAEALSSVWAQSRARILPLLQQQSRLSEIQEAVNEWLARIDDTARRAAAIVPAAAAPLIARARARLRRIWTEGIDWAERSLRDLALAVARPIATVGAGVIVLLLGWAWWKRRKGPK